ncbi:MAG: hypothetical protein SGI86_20755 [Deltaproteobacteria bacterium]|nr:hypothetical protein [Deltaproteobacteria bacterium]
MNQSRRWVGVTLLCLGVGCRSRDSAPSEPEEVVPRLGTVVVRNGSNTLPVAGLRPDALTEKARAQLAASGVFQPEANTAAPRANFAIALLVEIGPGEDAALRAVAAAELKVTVSPPTPAASRFLENVEAAADAPMPSPESGATAAASRVEAFSDRLLDDLLRDYIGRVRLGRAKDDAVLAALGSPISDVREEAARISGERKLKAGADRLLVLLSDPEERVRDASLGALIILRERRAVAELGKTRSMRDAREMAKILEAISVLGGPEAVSYLEFVVDAHPDATIQALAREALARTRRTK